MGDGGMDSAPGGQSEQDGPSGQESVLWRGELHSSTHLRVFVGRTFGELFNALATEEALAMGLYRPPERDGHPDALPHVRAPATKGFSVFLSAASSSGNSAPAGLRCSTWGHAAARDRRSICARQSRLGDVPPG